MKSVFIQLASYHDAELLPTIQDLIYKSSGEVFLHFGVHNSYFEENLYPDNFIQDSIVDSHTNYKISIVHSKFPDNIGVNASRYVANELYDGEDFYLQIDSHMVFCYHWDTRLIKIVEDSQAQGIAKPILSNYISGYKLDSNNKEQYKNYLSRQQSNERFLEHFLDGTSWTSGFITTEGTNEFNSTIELCLNVSLTKEQIKNIFDDMVLSACFIFTVGSFSKIKPNRSIMYFADESLIAIRAYTHGFTLVKTSEVYCKHLSKFWSREWEDSHRRDVNDDIDSLDKDKWDTLKHKSIEVVRSMLLNNVIGKESLGSERDFSGFVKLMLETGNHDEKLRVPMRSIFVQIASYHDLELQSTIVDILSKSSGDYRIDFGVHNGYYKHNIYGNLEIEKALSLIDKPYTFAIQHSRFPDNVGIGMSRYIANELYSGQNYYLQVDSHMRFINNWDNVLVDRLHEALDSGVPKPVLCGFPAQYLIDGLDPDDGTNNNLLSKIDFDKVILRSDQQLDEHGELASGILKDILQLDIPFAKVKENFQKFYLSGSFGFSIGEYHKVKPNKKILHKGEESFHSFRLWTHGFDKVELGLLCCYHYSRKNYSMDDRKFASDHLWIIDRRRISVLDLDNETSNKLLDINTAEIREIIEKNILGSQGFGTERDFQGFLQSVMRSPI